MKVRWTESSLRLRITPGELAALQSGEAITTALLLPGGDWSMAIQPEAVTQLIAQGSRVTLRLAPEDLEQLSSPENEGVYFHANDSATTRLRYYVEKDFPSIHPRSGEAEETPTETFAPPMGFLERNR